uniref:Integral membrane protein n=1 Tax=Streptomyces sp. NBC_00008 TaxID=2903610 RepID=A0AAU2VP63_9ACTN
MLALRLARGSHPLVLVRRLLVAAASAGVGFLLLCTLGYASGHPAHSAGSVLRLLWCFVPLAATVQFAVAVARTDPSTRPRPGLSAVGLGPVRLSVLAAVSTAVSCTLGSMVALLFFLHLRGDLSGLPFDGAAAGLLGADASLPLAAVVVLLTLVPAVAATASALALRTSPVRAAGVQDGARDLLPEEQVPAPAAPPAGLPWGVALTAAGLAVEAYASRGSSGSPFPLPGKLDSTPAWVLVGWTLTAIGLATAGPSLTHLAGRLLQAVRPGAVRLLAGRVLMDEARRIGRPLGVVCAVLSAVIAAFALYGTGPRPFGPLTALGAVLVIGCTTATLLTSALEARQARAETAQALLRLGAPASALRAATALRAAALLLVFAPLTWAIAELAALPLTG